MRVARWSEGETVVEAGVGEGLEGVVAHHRQKTARRHLEDGAGQGEQQSGQRTQAAQQPCGPVGQP